MGRPVLMILAGSLAGLAVTAQAHHSWGEEAPPAPGGGGGGMGGMGRDGAQYDFNIGDEVVIDGRLARDETQRLIQMTSLLRPSDGWTVTASLGRGGR